MKFVKPNADPSVELPSEILQMGSDFELIHASEWKQNEGAFQACWSNNLEPQDLINLIVDGQAPTVLQGENPDFENDVRAWVALREKPESYFSKPLQTLMPTGQSFVSHQIHKSTEKEDLRAKIREFGAANGNSSCCEHLEAIFEELFMNAMLDAPRESRIVRKDHSVLFHLASDERRIGISCEDPYGSLKITKLLKRMKEVYERGAGEAINLRGPGGAGLGCTIMLEKSSLICFGVKPDQKTTVSCLIHRHLSNRKRAELKKSFHLLVSEIV